VSAIDGSESVETYPGAEEARLNDQRLAVIEAATDGVTLSGLK
jgi:hypothetical protein